MATFGIESNGRIEKTAIYYNGEQLAGVREVFINLDEHGTFDAIIQYLGRDGQLQTKQIFTDYFDNVQTREPSFTEEEAASLRLLVIDSDGSIESTHVAINDEEQFGIVSLFIHIKAPHHTSGGLRSIFGGQKNIPERPEFVVQVTYRNDDDTLSTEGIF